MTYMIFSKMGEETKTNLKTSQNFQYKLEFHLAVRNFLITRGCGGNRADKKTQEENSCMSPDRKFQIVLKFSTGF